MKTKKIYLTQMAKNGKNKNSVLDPDLPPPDKSNEPPPISYLQMFRYTTRFEKFLLFLGLLATLAMAGIQPLNNLFVGDMAQNIVDYAKTLNTTDQKIIDAAGDKLIDDVTFFAYEMFGIGLLMLVLGYIAIETFSYTSLNQIHRIRDIYTNKVLNQDIPWYDQHQTGDFASKMSDDLNKLEDGIGDKIANFIYMQVIFVASLILAFIKGWQLTLVCLTSLPLTMICVTLVSCVSAKLSKNESDAYGSAGAIAEEVLGTVRTVLAFGGEAKEIERYEKNLVIAKKNNILRGALNGFTFGLIWFFIYCSYALAFWYGVGLIIDGMDEKNPTYDAGTMMTVFFSVMTASMNFGLSSTYVEIISKAKAAGTKIFAVIDTVPVINASKNKGEKLDTMGGTIEFKDVKFHYPSRKGVPVLEDLNMVIRSGQTVALVGSSGCGKSTCIQMLQRFYDPESGAILIDGHNLRDLDLTWYRRHIAVVGQEPVLFATTIEDNIRYGNENCTEEDIIDAAKKANAYDFVTALPKGFKTVVGERGAQISGGQKQRIAIARALVRNPSLLLLDEATSALDNESESKVQAALDEASRGRTTIIVAHRLSTIRYADKIIVMSKGKIIEQGTHDELMALKNEYFNLVTHQITNETDNENSNESEKKIIKCPELKNSISVNSDDQSKFDEEEPVDEINSVSFWQIIKLNAPEWPQITVASIASIICGCSVPVFALIFGDVVGALGETVKDQIRDKTDIYCLYFVIVGTILGLFTTLNIYLYSQAGELLTLRLRGLLFKAMLKQEIGWYDRKENGVGALCARLAGEAALVQGATGQRLGTIVNSLTTLVVSVGMSMYYSWQLGLLLLAFAPIMMFAIFMQARIMSTENESNLKSLEQSTKVAVEAIINIRTVASLTAENLFHNNFRKELHLHQRRMLRNSHIKSFVFGLSRGITFVAYGAAMFYGGYLMKDGLPAANVYKVSQALIMGTVTIANALAFSPNLQRGIKAASNTLKLLNRVPKIKDIPTANEAAWKKGTINYSQLYFSYPTRPSVPILKGLDLEVLEGKTVALVGSSGCGKSTIVQLIERFYDPNSGSVTVDKDDLRNIKLSSLRSHLGIVSQEPNLFDRTIGENIAYGDNTREVTQIEIMEAAKQANIHDFIISLPLGYDTRLGEKGTQLSGGQKQRIAIARALIRNPKVLLLDEATSALDTESEKVVQEALDKAKKNRTCITIAHRLTTIQDADLICVINKGKVAEVGNHQDLLQEKGLYHQLYSLQGK